MRSTLVLVVFLAALAGGCGGGSDSGAPGANGRSATSGGQCPTTSADSCPAAKTYETCVIGKCDAPYKAAFGAGYASGNFSGGACASLLTCYMKCPCDATATTCELACYTQRDATCDTAMAAVTTCVMGSGCAYPVCSDAGTGTLPTSTLTSTLTSTSTLTRTSTSTSTSTGSTTGSCAAVSACCAKLIAGSNAVTYQQTCQVITSYGEATCAQILSGWVSAGVCQ